MDDVDTRRHSKVLVGLCYAVATGVLVQAVLAGLFLSGVQDARTVHLVVGWLLPYFALAVAVVAFIQRRRGHVSRNVVIGGVSLPVVLWIQEVLGAVPASATTAIHVPLGVALFGYSLLLGLASTRGAEEGFTMSDKDGDGATSPTLRLVMLIVAGLVIANVVAARLFERDTGLGVDELLVAVGGVGLAFLVEFAVFRRRRW